MTAPTSVREALDRIEDILIACPCGTHDNIRGGVIDVLTALRSCDVEDTATGDPYLKASGTNHVRMAAFPRLLAESSDDDCSGGRWLLNRDPLVTHDGLAIAWRKGNAGSHFVDHLRNALKQLGLLS